MPDKILANGWMQTYQNHSFNPFNPQDSEIDLGDIAHALSMSCRFGGHCQDFYSVAQHAILTSFLCQEQGWSIQKQYAALHHDDSEAYLVDIPRPIKAQLPFYKEAEKKLEELLENHFQFKTDSDVKWADSWMLEIERGVLFREKMVWPDLEEWLDTTTEPKASGFHFLVQLSKLYPHTSKSVSVDWYFWSPRDAEKAFLTRHFELWSKINAK